MQEKFCSVCYDIVTCRLSTGFLLRNTEGARAQGQEMGDVLAPPTQPRGCVGASGARLARENPHGKRQSHILAVVHNPKQIVHRTTGLWLLVQLSPIWKPCRTRRREGGFTLAFGEHGSDKIPSLFTQLSPQRKRALGTGLCSKQRSDLSAAQPSHCSLSLPLLSVPEFPSSQECNLPLPQLAFTYSSQTCFSWNIIIQKVTSFPFLPCQAMLTLHTC